VPTQLLRLPRLLRLFRLTKLLKVVRASRIFRRWERKFIMTIRYGTMRLLQFGVITLMVVHWLVSK
jgi:hypothetical protein